MQNQEKEKRTVNSRVLKFRAWDVINNKMLPPFGLDKGKQLVYRLAPGRFEVMQYTGLKDKNGKEIYEGDIVNHRYGKEQVEFVDGCFYPFTAGAANSPLGSESEVIGNIYERKHLLDGKE